MLLSLWSSFLLLSLFGIVLTSSAWFPDVKGLVSATTGQLHMLGKSPHWIILSTFLFLFLFLWLQRKYLSPSPFLSTWHPDNLKQTSKNERFSPKNKRENHVHGMKETGKALQKRATFRSDQVWFAEDEPRYHIQPQSRDFHTIGCHAVYDVVWFLWYDRTIYFLSRN